MEPDELNNDSEDSLIWLHSNPILHEIAECISEAFLVVSGDWKDLLYCSPGFEAITGVNPDSYDGAAHHLFDLMIDPSDRESVRQFIQSDSPHASKKSVFEFRIYRRDLSKRWVRLKINPMHRKRRFALVLEDITEQREANNLLHLTQHTVDQSSDAIYWFSDDGQLFYVNEAACKQLGYAESELLGLSFAEIDPTFSLPVTSDCDELLDISRHHRKDGTKLIVDFFLKRYSIGDESINVASVRDVTDRIASQEQIAQQTQQIAHMNRLNSMNEMGAALTHELNQPLTAICNYAYVLTALAEREELSQELLHATEEVAKQAHRAGEVARRMKSFVSKRRTQRNDGDVNEIVTETLQLLQPDLLRAKVSVRCELEAGLPTAFVDCLQIQQVLVNLIKNACDALVDAAAADPRIEIHSAYQPSSDDMTVTVSDNGPGVSQQELEHLFDPFTTTKSDGMGMGLAISKTIAEAHDGDLSAARIDQGIQFTLRFKANAPNSQTRRQAG